MFIFYTEIKINDIVNLTTSKCNCHEKTFFLVLKTIYFLNVVFLILVILPTITITKKTNYFLSIFIKIRMICTLWVLTFIIITFFFTEHWLKESDAASTYLIPTFILDIYIFETYYFFLCLQLFDFFLFL